MEKYKADLEKQERIEDQRREASELRLYREGIERLNKRLQVNERMDLTNLYTDEKSQSVIFQDEREIENEESSSLGSLNLQQR